ncbi:MAG TPA: hypothetical protein VLM11_14540 [Streptosporangiaceae bacterium]|nr:hypothetical protein [Streptosporangiaceae bacterium]
MTGSAERRVARLLRWYPRSWRVRYGAEFAELLLAELAEQPCSWRRSADVAAHGLLARCTGAGLTGHSLSPREQIRCGVATLCCAIAVFLTFGVAMLAQLATGWQWATPRSAFALDGSLAMSLGAAGLMLIAVLGAVPAAWCAAVTAVRSRDTRLMRSASLVLVAGGVLVIGARHFQNAWPGTGGTGALHTLVPAGIAAFGWASTLSVSSFWVHPAVLGSLPASVLAWMAVSPFAVLGLVAGCAAVVRRLPLPSWLLIYLARLSVAATVTAVPFLAGAASWVLATAPAQPDLFRPGLINGGELAMMALALVVALRVAAGVRRAIMSVIASDC